MAAIIAAGLCSQGCGAAAAAAASMAGGPIVGALGVAAAAIGFGIYSFSKKGNDEEFFEDAVEGEIQGGVKVALAGGSEGGTTNHSAGSSLGFL